MRTTLLLAAALVACKDTKPATQATTTAPLEAPAAGDAAGTSTPTPTPTPTPDAAPITAIAAPPSGDAELLNAAATFASANAAPDLKPTLTVTVREGGFAQLQAVPKDDSAERAMVFMKWKGTAWIGVDIGTSISCEDLGRQGFPEVVRKGCD